jgi:fructokinase
MMRNVFCIGETVYDIIFKEGKPVAAKAGGSMLNSSVSMGRMKLIPSFISEYGKDEIGNEIEKFLSTNHVNTRHVFRYENGKTSIAIAFLNAKNDANYSFYKQLPEKRLIIDSPKIEKDDILLFGSFFAINREIRKQLESIVASARHAGAIVIYDPNFRKAHLHELSDLLPLIIENMKMASIVRGSNEDFQMIFNAGTVEEAYSYVSKYCPVLLYTANTKGVHLKAPDIGLSVPVRKLTPVSTIGAGDNFNAGLIYGLLKENIRTNDLTTKFNWQKLLQYGIDFASEVCMSYDNYISEEFAEKYALK